MDNYDKYRASDGRFYYLYKITTDFDSSYYYGKHVADDIDDGYMGSGSELLRLQKEHGIEHFQKTIIKFFENNSDLLKYESLIVTNDLLKDPMCINISPGGGWDYTNWIVSKDKNGIVHIVSKNDPRWISGELVGITKGYGIFKDTNGRHVFTLIDDPRISRGELVGITKGDFHMPAKDTRTGKNIRVTKDDPRWKTKDIISHTSGQVTVKDSKGCTYNVSVEEYNNRDDLNQVTKGTLWIHKDGTNKRVSPENLQDYIKNDWILGKIENTIWMYKDTSIKKVKLIDVEKYISVGWSKGRPFSWSTSSITT